MTKVFCNLCVHDVSRYEIKNYKLSKLIYEFLNLCESAEKSEVNDKKVDLIYIELKTHSDSMIMMSV